MSKILDALNPNEFRSYQANCINVMNACGAKAIQNEYADQREREYIEDRTAYQRMSIEEREEYDRLYLAYKEAENKFLEYKNYVYGKAFNTGLMSTKGSIYFSEKEV